MTIIPYEPAKGESLYVAIEQAIEFAKSNASIVSMSFNDTPLQIHPNSYANDIATIYHLLRERN